MYNAVDAEGPFSTEKRRQSVFKVRKLNEIEKMTIESLSPPSEELLKLSRACVVAVFPQGSLNNFMTDRVKAAVDLNRISSSSTMEKGVKEVSQLGAIV